MPRPHRCPECGAEVFLERFLHETRFSVLTGASTNPRAGVATETSGPIDRGRDLTMLATETSRSRDDAAVVERWRLADRRDELAKPRAAAVSSVYAASRTSP